MQHSKLFSRTGLVLVAVIAIALIALTNLLFSGARVDLTENKLYSVSDGAKRVLSELDEPINLYYFYSKDAAADTPVIKNYATRVRAMLKEMEQAAGGKLNLVEVDPEPFSEAEDRAVSLGLEGLPTGDGDTLYFGIAGTNALDETQILPFLHPNQERLLEYDLAKLVYQLAQVDKPVVGLISGLDMGGGFDRQAMRQNPEWLVIDQLRQFFEIEQIGYDATEIPAEVKTLVIAHPAGLPEPLVYAIDQYVLTGGHALVFLDAYAESTITPPGDMMAEPTSQSSDLATILAPMGLTISPESIVGDPENALVVGNGSGGRTYHLAMIGIPGDSALNSGDDVVTEGLEQVNFAFSGALDIADDAPMEITPLLQTSAVANRIPSFRIQPGAAPDALRSGFEEGDTPLTLAVRVRGEATSAFEAPPEGSTIENHTSASAQPVNLIVVADTDMLRDGLWVQLQNFYGQQLATPFASNGDFVVNAIDNLMGSSDLIGIRARASYSRPFTVVEDLRRDAEAEFLATQEDIQRRLRETERKLAELQSQAPEGSEIMSAEQSAEIQQFRADKRRLDRQLRDVQLQLNKGIEGLGTKLKLINIALVPLVLTVLMLVLALVRRKRRRAASDRHNTGA